MTYTIIHLIRYSIVLLILLLSFFSIFTHKADAYLTTGQEAIAIDSHSGLFSIDYEFGHESHEMHLPIFANLGGEQQTSRLTYQIIDETGREVSGKTAGIVFSNAPLGKSMYEISKGVAKKFSLVVVFTPSENTSGHTYRLQVTNLPFSFDGSQQLQLNPSELKYYTTKSIAL